MPGFVNHVRLGCALVAALLAAGGGVTMAAGAQPRSTAATVQISIHETGLTPNTQNTAAQPQGTFRIELALSPTSHRGTTRIAPDPGQTGYVDGETQVRFAGVDTLRSTDGVLELAFSGIHIPINTNLTANGLAVGPAVEHGTWHIKSASGSYEGWKGGGVWAAVINGYGKVSSYAVEWDGKITR